MMRSELYPGQIVHVNLGKGVRQLARVDKINPVNIKITSQDGTVYNAHPMFLSEVDPTTAATFEVAETTKFVAGTGVRFKPTATAWKRICKYPVLVVLGKHGNKYRLAPLGGDNGRYFSGVPAEAIEVVNLNVEGC